MFDCFCGCIFFLWGVVGGLLYISSDEPKGNERMWGQKWRKIADKEHGWSLGTCCDVTTWMHMFSICVSVSCTAHFCVQTGWLQLGRSHPGNVLIWDIFARGHWMTLMHVVHVWEGYAMFVPVFDLAAFIGISEPPWQDFGGWESEPSPRGLWAFFESLYNPLKSLCVQCSSQGAFVAWCQDFPWFPFLDRIHRLPAVLQGSLLDDAATQKALQSFKRLLSFHEKAERILTCVQFGKRLPRNGVLWLPFGLE